MYLGILGVLVPEGEYLVEALLVPVPDLHTPLGLLQLDRQQVQLLHDVGETNGNLVAKEDERVLRVLVPTKVDKVVDVDRNRLVRGVSERRE